MSLFSQIRANMKMQRDADPEIEDKPWSMSDMLQGKIGDQLKGFGKMFVLAIETIIKTFSNSDDEESLYDLDGDSPGEWSPERVKIWIINGVNIFIGLIGGFIVQNYLSYRSLRFMAFAAGVDFSELHGRTLSSPITIIMDIVFFVAFYTVLVIIFTCAYYIMHFLFQKDMLDCKEICQVGYMYGVMCTVISGLIGVILPFNIFM